MYLFATPNKFFFQWIFNRRMWGEGDAHIYEPPTNLSYTDDFLFSDRMQASGAWSFEIVTLVLLAGLYAHLVEEPLIQRFRRFSDKYTRASRPKLHQG